MFQNRPALRVVMLFAAGIILAGWIPLSPSVVFFLVMAMVILSVLMFRTRNHLLAAEFLLECSIVLLGLLLQLVQRTDFHTRELNPRIADEPVLLMGIIETEPVRQDRRISCIVRTDRLIRQGRFEQDPRNVMLLMRLDRKDSVGETIEFGKRITVNGILEPFPFQRNAGEFDYGKYLELNEIAGIVSVKGLKNIQVDGEGEGNIFLTSTHTVQKALYRIVDRFHTPRHASFLKGIIFGYRADIPPDIKQSFTDTGTIHILAVSGSNVAFVAFILFSLFGLFRLPRKAVVAVTMLGLLAYMVITGSSASVIRATIMALVLLGGTLFERKADIYNSISVAALILLCWNTNTFFDVGFQLSFTAVISIVYFFPRLELLIKKIPDRFKEIKGIDVILKLFAVSLAAQLGTVPFMAYYFNRISIISLAANIVVVPLSGLTTFIGAAEILMDFFSSWIAQYYSVVNDFLIWFLLGFVRQAASVPFATVEAWQFTSAVILGYYLLVIGLFNLHLPRLRAWMVIGILLICCSELIAAILAREHPRCTATILDVGQGDAILLEFPNKKRMLIDAGPDSKQFDAGERTIVPYLKRRGISTLDYFVITHAHSDHLGGAGSVLKHLEVDTLILSSLTQGGRLFKEILGAAEANHCGIKIVAAGDLVQIDSLARVYVLGPENDRPGATTLNNLSVVLKVVYGSSSLLLAGDAEKSLEQTMMPKFGRFLSSNVLKAGHHGSKTSTSLEFLNDVRPEIILISVGMHNTFNHPSPSTLTRMNTRSAEIIRTDQRGAIILESDGVNWKQRKWRQEPV